MKGPTNARLLANQLNFFIGTIMNQNNHVIRAYFFVVETLFYIGGSS